MGEVQTYRRKKCILSARETEGVAGHKGSHREALGAGGEGIRNAGKGGDVVKGVHCGVCRKEKERHWQARPSLGWSERLQWAMRQSSCPQLSVTWPWGVRILA